MTINELAENSANIQHTYKVTPDVYYSFQRCSNDYNPLHTDEAFAVQRGFEGRVMYGNILNAFVSHFVGMVLPSRNVMIQTQDIAYRKPVFMNDEILLKTEIETISEAVGIINYKLKFYRIGGDKPLLLATGHVQIGLI